MTNPMGSSAVSSQSTFFTEDDPAPARMQYHLLPSVWQGEDTELLELMLGFYPDFSGIARRPCRPGDAANVVMEVLARTYTVGHGLLHPPTTTHAEQAPSASS